VRQSQLFTKTRREAPKDEEAKNAQLLIRAGFVNKEMAGVYSLLPLGLRVINKIKKIVSEEMQKLGSAEILMSTLQSKEIWQMTDRWDDEKVDVWFKSELKNGTEVGFGWSHEEPITEMMKSHISSYNNLPRALHQFQNKLRNEVRAKSGIMRCREFVMKDMYYFASTEEENNLFYNNVIDAYKNVFERVGLGDITYVTSASGGVFTDKFSHEFQTVCGAGEDMIYVNQSNKIALNEEIFNKETLEKMGHSESDFEKTKAAEVGNIFNFGTAKSEAMGLYYTSEEGDKKPVFLSSYGIGITRLMGVVAEVFSAESSMVWPKSIAPFDIHLIEIAAGKPGVREKAEEVYKRLGEKYDVLYDDRDLRAGEKFADADLIGIPYSVVVSEKGIAGGTIEVKNRKTGETENIAIEQIDQVLSKG
jgi:prolyl-tRNA synthetase